MADKAFGVKDINLIGASGTPTIESPNNLNINAVNVAISTDITVAGKVSLGAGTSISSPGSNELTFGTNSTEKVRISTNGDIGIANPSPTNWGGGVPTIEIKGTASTGSNSTRSGAIVFESGSGSNGYAVLWGQSGGIHIYTGATDRASATYAAQFNSSGNLAFASGNGIDFSATSDGGTSTPSELLDDYEEGSWDPQILGWNGSYSIQEGRYIKIGRMVHVIGEVKTSANAGNSFTNAWPGLSNLPFVNTTSFQGVSGSQRCMGYGTILGDVSPGGTNGQAFVTFDRNTGNNAFFPNHISSQGAQNFQNTMINNPTTADFGYRYNCTYYTD